MSQSQYERRLVGGEAVALHRLLVVGQGGEDRWGFRRGGRTTWCLCVSRCVRFKAGDVGIDGRERRRAGNDK